MPNVHNGEDMATWLTILKKIPYAHGLNIELSTYRQVSNSLSQGFINKLSRMWKVYRNIEHLSFFYSCYCYVIYLNNVLKKRKVK